MRSQYFGGMIWGISFALHEEAVTDGRTGRIMNAGLAEYHVPVNTDVPSQMGFSSDERPEPWRRAGAAGLNDPLS